MRTTVTIDDELWNEVRRVEPHPSNKQLIEKGLRALIDQAARRRAIALGGSMPDIEAPPRRLQGRG